MRIKIKLNGCAEIDLDCKFDQMKHTSFAKDESMGSASSMTAVVKPNFEKKALRRCFYNSMSFH